MARDNAFYIIDVYVPNPGEPESALELTILRYTNSSDLPSVYVHTYLQIQPALLNRIRWNQAAEHGLDRDMFINNNMPTLTDIEVRDYLKDKTVLCFCENIEPVQTLVANSFECYSIVSMWRDVFAGDEAAMSINTVEGMLDYMGLPSRDPSNTRYTYLMKRARAYMAIRHYLFNCKYHHVRPSYGDNSLSQSDYWPLKSVQLPWYSGEPRSLSEIPTESIQAYFSNRLIDYIPWKTHCIYEYDWTFGREVRPEVRINKQDRMMDFIFNKVFNLKTRIQVLTFYSLYHKQTDYAREVAMHHGSYNTMRVAIKEDFSAFVISHLDDFLSARQKHDIIKALVEQCLNAKDEAKNVENDLDFDKMYKNASENNLKFKVERIDDANSFRWYKEIAAEDDIIYRCFIIKGDKEQQALCIDLINDKLRELLTDAHDPFSPTWLTQELKLWISSITGFAWQEIARDPRPSDSTSLSEVRQTIRTIIKEASAPYCKTYASYFKSAVNGINELGEDESRVFAFCFMGIIHRFEVDKSEESIGMWGKIRKVLFGKDD
ncbi:hypothetical protein [uncultured Anaerobiospirillum sp.]|uniref:hypothetical protein n=1 Tax=uncultured Anaerobiospirillum sp. TaxID=265728 RepID=UPI0028055F01|nr:hypothetical protein [uncultured Anaerobiospirillum sp.]